mmetsp:Transcript_41689/g.111158  ORF Transcript_41689/g.111158 Transcript_41689/m.111158 type:complete len:269 (-) Transcript_41689:125-931(-)
MRLSPRCAWCRRAHGTARARGVWLPPDQRIDGGTARVARTPHVARLRDGGGRGGATGERARLPAGGVAACEPARAACLPHHDLQREKAGPACCAGHRDVGRLDDRRQGPARQDRGGGGAGRRWERRRVLGARRDEPRGTLARTGGRTVPREAQGGGLCRGARRPLARRWRGGARDVAARAARRPRLLHVRLRCDGRGAVREGAPKAGRVGDLARRYYPARLGGERQAARVRAQGLQKDVATLVQGRLGGVQPTRAGHLGAAAARRQGA